MGLCSIISIRFGVLPSCAHTKDGRFETGGSLSDHGSPSIADPCWRDPCHSLVEVAEEKGQETSRRAGSLLMHVSSLD